MLHQHQCIIRHYYLVYIFNSIRLVMARVKWGIINQYRHAELVSAPHETGSQHGFSKMFRVKTSAEKLRKKADKTVA